ncbi:hypothetical protein D3C78_1767220 [compost metagenome]
MGRADHMGNACFDGHARQIQGRFQVRGAVIDARQQVIVQVDHGTSPGFPWARTPLRRSSLGALAIIFGLRPFAARRASEGSDSCCSRSSRSNRRSDSRASEPS